MVEKFCPVCKYKNDANASTCAYCGSPLGSLDDSAPSTTRNVVGSSSPAPTPEELLAKRYEAPKQGIAVYTETSDTPISIQVEKEFVLGRKMTGEMDESFIDLRPFGAYENGVSRRHAMIRRSADGYEILDLGSTNGTWIEKQRIVPNRPYPLKSGSRIFLGRLQLLVVFQ